jgi:RNA polymerase sigma factor (sigma-70 family)
LAGFFVGEMREREIGADKHLTQEEEVHLAKLLEAGRAARGKLAKNPDVSGAEKSALTAQISQGFAARSCLVVSNLGLVGGVARGYLNRGMSYRDIFQNGSTGLIRAVDKFDYRRGRRLSTLAVWWIMDAITDGFKKSKEADVHGDFPLSLDAPCGGGDGKRANLGEILIDANATPLEASVEEELARETVLAICEQTLTPQEKTVVYHQFNLNRENAPAYRGRHAANKAPILKSALEALRASPSARALLEELR